MGPSLNDATLIQYQNKVRLHEALNAMGDDKGRPILHELFQCLAYYHLRFHVHRRG